MAKKPSTAPSSKTRSTDKNPARRNRANAEAGRGSNRDAPARKGTKKGSSSSPTTRRKPDEEELETSREDEELSTVNNQLEEKVRELEATNDDLSNLLTSTEIATFFLDTDLRIRRFTPSCTELLNIIAGDIGRPISDLSPRVNDPRLLADARRVLEELSPLEKEVRSADGRAFMRRIHPYRTSANEIDGVVVTFTDITSLHAAHHKIEIRERQQAAVAKLGQFALASGEIQPLLDLTSSLLAETLEVDLVKILRLEPGGKEFRLASGVGWKAGLVGLATVGGGRNSQAGFTLESRGPVIVQYMRSEDRFRETPLLTEHGVVSGVSVIIGSGGEPWGVLGAHHRSPREFTIDDVNFLQAVAHVLFEAIRRREAEQRVLDRERRLDLLTDAVPALIAYCDRDLVYRFCNGQYEAWFGVKPEDIIGTPLADVIGEKAFERVRPHVEKALGGESVSFEAKLPFRHGPPRDVHVSYAPHKAEDGEVIGYYAMIEDVSERVKAEQTPALLAAIVEHSHDAIIGKDLNGIVTSWNTAAERVYGYRAEEIVGKPVTVLAPDESAEVFLDILERVRRGEATEQLETVRRRKDGTLVDVLLTVSPIRDSSGGIVGASSIAHDITERIRAERELQEWADRLEERVAERTAVARKRAEELRELASQVAHAEQRVRRQLARNIHDDLQQLLVATKMRLPVDGGVASAEELETVGKLLDEALDKSRVLVSELSPPVLQDGSLPAALEWLARQTQDRHGLSVEVEYESEFDDVNENIRTVVFEAVRELLFNVVKHAETDTAKVVLERAGTDLTVLVADSGRGFDPSAVLERSNGFGLLNVRERIAAFGGRVEIDAVPGRGARFELSVPLKLEPEGTAKPGPPPAAQVARSPRTTADGPVRILVIDDHRIVREGLIRILSSEPGMEVVGEADNGEEAVELAVELVPDVVLMDITMPRMNGIEATRRIAESVPSAVVIGLSLHDEEDLGNTIRHAGAVAFLRKDSASQRLIEVIRQHSMVDLR